MVYRENELPKWRHVTISHYDAAEILKGKLDYDPWVTLGGRKIISSMLMSRAVTLFLNRLYQAGIKPEHVQVTFHPEKPSDYSAGDGRSSYSIFYFGLHRVLIQP
jgi:hypothetical protein